MKSKPSHNFTRNIFLTALLVVLAGTLSAQTAPAGPKAFSTPEAAFAALLSAAESGNSAAMMELFGPDGKDLVYSGDPVRDKEYLQAFVARTKQRQSVVIDPPNSGRAVLVLGPEEWPMPVPVVKRKGKWYFDAASGLQEVIDRRVGANELDAIQVCRGYVNAQFEYASTAHDNSGFHQYAQKLISTPGKHDGLFWRNPDGSAGGPVSEPIARAIEEGYTPEAGRGGYHGYYFKILKGQGPAAPMGELDYVIKGMMIGGFALIATPIEYRVTGVKTFIINNDGILYEKDLGPDSLKIAKTIERYNPDKTWHATDAQWPPDTGN